MAGTSADRRHQVAAAIIAGGQGTRLGGTDKSALVVGGRTILARQVEALRGRFSRILLVLAPAAPPADPPSIDTRAPATPAAPPSIDTRVPATPDWPSVAAPPSDVVVVRDRAPAGSGPLAGLDAALAALAPGEESLVCLAADMPLVSAAPLELLRDTAPEAQALVPLVAGHPEPLFARYHRSCAPAVAAAIAGGRLKTMGLLAWVQVHWLPEPALRAVDPTLTCLHNINTPEDLARAEDLLAG